MTTPVLPLNVCCLLTFWRASWTLCFWFHCQLLRSSECTTSKQCINRAPLVATVNCMCFYILQFHSMAWKPCIHWMHMSLFIRKIGRNTSTWQLGQMWQHGDKKVSSFLIWNAARIKSDPGREVCSDDALLCTAHYCVHSNDQPLTHLHHFRWRGHAATLTVNTNQLILLFRCLV